MLVSLIVIDYGEFQSTTAKYYGPRGWRICNLVVSLYRALLVTQSQLMVDLGNNETTSLARAPVQGSVV